MGPIEIDMCVQHGEDEFVAYCSSSRPGECLYQQGVAMLAPEGQPLDISRLEDSPVEARTYLAACGECGYDLVACVQLWFVSRKCCPDCTHPQMVGA